MYQVITEHDDFLVVDKQANVSMHNENGEGLIEKIRQDFKTHDIYPVHRLDKPTSGILICAKNASANSQLSQLFENRKVEKYYLAISHYKPKKKQGLIVGDMTRTRSGNWKLLKTQNNPAITQFISYGIGQEELDRGKRVFILKPFTGKTHQLRVALKSLGSPIDGDKRYGRSTDAEKRMHLHAYCLGFNYKDVQYQFKNFPTGDSFNENFIRFVKEKLNEPWLLPWPVLPKKLI